MKRKYLLQTDRTDPRDHIFNAVGLPIAQSSDLRAGFPEPFDQGQLGSCTGNGWAGVLSFIHGKTVASRLMIYWGERNIEGTVRSDAGAQIRDGAKFLAQSGACVETAWPYIISKFRSKPPKKCFDEAAAFKISSYQRLTSLNDILACLTAGFPVVGGIAVYASFESNDVAQTGMVPMPAKGEQCLGGHAIVFCGHDMANQRLLVRNSWGTGWGIRGYFWLPFAYITKPGLADDFWTVRK